MAVFSVSQAPQHEIVFIPLRQISAKPAIPAAISDLTGQSAALLEQVFQCKTKEVFQCLTAKGKRVFLLGLGENVLAHQVTEIIRLTIFQHQSSLSGKINIDLRHLDASEQSQDIFAAAVEGAVLGMHVPVKPLKKQEKQEKKITDILICLDHKWSTAETKRLIHRGRSIAEVRLAVIDLVNTPANLKTPVLLAKWAEEQGKKYGIEVKVLKEKELKAQGFHALLAIGQGSPNESVFIQMFYRGNKKKTTDLGLVGKGITFDTGGISIKPSDNMHFMKSDMGGAAMMMGGIMIAAALKLPINLTTVVASAENMPDGQAIKPSDVFSSYSGKTIEMIDTDAEGRVVLADALAWMVKHEKPAVMIDAATLTGSIVRTLGYKAGGLFSKNEQLNTQLANSGIASGERLWSMPMWDDYHDEISSDVADVRNFSGVATSGAISAAKFLEVFTENHSSWAHLDIAGMAFVANPYTKMRSATGYGVKLLLHFMEKQLNP
jgi:leucyl aminopeptidase